MERPTNDIIDLIFKEEQPPDWAVSGLFLQGGVYALGGEAGAGKSSLSYTLAIAAATGEPCLSGCVGSVSPKRILYFDEENSPQDRVKYIRWAFYGLEAVNKREPSLDLLVNNLWCCTDKLGDEGWEANLIEWVDEVRPHIMIFDTANPCFNVDDENSNSEASKIVKKLRRISKRLEDTEGYTITVIILKHAKIRVDGSNRTLRGAKAWQGAVDGVVFQVKAPGRPKKEGLSLTRLEPGKTRAFGLGGPIYISPEWLGPNRKGLILRGDVRANAEHKAVEKKEEEAAK